MAKKLTVLVILVHVIGFAVAQNHRVDSLLRLLSNEKSEENGTSIESQFNILIAA